MRISDGSSDVCSSDLRDVDKRAFADIVAELAALAEKARTKGLSIEEMSGSSMCLSSLGHIGGTGFTPIINAPDIAILGAPASSAGRRVGNEGVRTCSLRGAPYHTKNKYTTEVI